RIGLLTLHIFAPRKDLQEVEPIWYNNELLFASRSCQFACIEASEIIYVRKKPPFGSAPFWNKMSYIFRIGVTIRNIV
ncbi:MAG: hypothetical protein M3Y56_16250, partial [Armatimonadota bacterium]|nr:hypothetical protein [Armatimonadota bacterium]